MPTVYYATLTVFGVGLLAILGHYAVQRYIARKEASKRLIEAFTETRHILSSHDITNNVYDSIFAAFDFHKKEVIIFSHHVSLFWKRGFYRAWNNYRYGINKSSPHPEEELPIPHLVQYYPELDERESQEETKALILQRIHKLLSYAKVK